MKIGVRIFFSCLAITGLCLMYPLYHIVDTISIHYREGVEDSLTDQANMLACLVEEEMREGRFSPESWRALFERIHGRKVDARIYSLQKNTVDFHVYITDSRGIVVFDSWDPSAEGRDYSRWRDVFLTLKGRYGARTTRLDKTDEASSRLYIAAPIYTADDDLAGVLTVVKPTTNIRYFVDGAQANIVRKGLLSLIGAGLLGFLGAMWITRPIKRLTAYARGIRDGKDPAFPRLDTSEIGELGRALAEMQKSLEGRRYVEAYVQHLTHELKSPLSAIRGAAELLAEPIDGNPMPPAQQQRFIANINTQSRRIQDMVDRMLELTALESRSFIETPAPVSINAAIHMICEEKEPLLIPKNLKMETDLQENDSVSGDGFLLHQALANLVQNAIEFSPQGGTVRISTIRSRHGLRVEIADEGPGLPDYATDRVFEKFFSLQRPDTGQKSTGLGLNFVRQVALLHGGRIVLDNLPQGGMRASLELPG